MKTIQRWGAVLLLAVPATVAAQEPQQPLETIPVGEAEVPAEAMPREYPYTWGAARLRHTDYDERAIDALGVEGSYLLLPNVYAVGAVFLGESDDTNSTESTQFEIGAGYRAPLPWWGMDLNAAFRYVTLRATRDTGPVADEVGYQFDAGVRTLLFNTVESTAGVQYAQIFEAGHTTLFASALYPVLPQLSVGADAAVGSSTLAYSLVGRWAF